MKTHKQALRTILATYEMVWGNLGIPSNTLFLSAVVVNVFANLKKKKNIIIEKLACKLNYQYSPHAE